MICDPLSYNTFNICFQEQTLQLVAIGNGKLTNVSKREKTDTIERECILRYFDLLDNICIFNTTYSYMHLRI